jgi:hypothetical protein
MSYGKPEQAAKMPAEFDVSRNRGLVVGQQVRVTSGVLQNLVGTVVAIDNPGRALLSFGNTPLKIAIDLGVIEPVPS